MNVMRKYFYSIYVNGSPMLLMLTYNELDKMVKTQHLVKLI